MVWYTGPTPSTVAATTDIPAHVTLDIPYYTEYDKDGVVYRAHPKYRGENPYYDWAYVQWNLDNNDTDEDTVTSIIARIMCFIRHPDGTLMAIIHSCDYDTDEQHGVFGTYYHLECQNKMHPRPKFSMVDVDNLEQHACMIPYDGNNPYTWLHVWHPSEWPGCFQTIEPPTD